MAQSRPTSAIYTNRSGNQNTHAGHGCQNANNASGTFISIEQGPHSTFSIILCRHSYRIDSNHADRHGHTENRGPSTPTESMRIAIPRMRCSQISLIRSIQVFDTPNGTYEQTSLLDPRVDPQRGPSLDLWKQTLASLFTWLPNLNKQDAQGLTVLHHAVKSRSYFALNVLLDLIENHPHALRLAFNVTVDLAALLNTPDYAGQTAAHHAVVLGDWHSFKLLAEKMSDLNKLADKQDQTILHLAAQWGRADIAKYVLDKGTNIDQQDRGRHTALHHAAMNGHHEVVRVLLGAGARRDVKEDCLEWTALHYAVIRKRLETVQVLARRSYNETDDELGLDVKDHQGRTALHLACHLEGGATELRIAGDMVSVLIAAKATLNVTDAVGCTPLMYAAARTNLAAVRCLVDKGADVDMRDGKRKRAKDYALDQAPRGKERDAVVKILSQHHGGEWPDGGGPGGGLCIAGQQEG
ncbi:ankyrin [Neurospora crassa]|nr:ankyrin [Neurospora crassa]